MISKLSIELKVVTFTISFGHTLGSVKYKTLIMCSANKICRSNLPGNLLPEIFSKKY